MFSKILIKLVDEAVLPAIVLIVTRIVSVVLVARYFDVPFSIGDYGFVYSNPSDYILINSYSVLSMLVVLSVGLIFILIKSYLFHETHITPRLTARLFSLRLDSFIQTSFDVYSQGAIWLSYTYLLTLITGLLSYTELLYSWVPVVGIVLSLITTYLFVLDVENEMFVKHSELDKSDGEFVLNLGNIEDEL